MDGRHRYDKRRFKKQSDERHERGSMRGGGAKSDGGAGGQEVLA